MALSWNEIKDRALKFTKEWEGESRERAEKDSFWNDFFNVFGISRRRLATFEEPVKKLNNKQGFIDLFWKGRLLVEHKSKGKNLDAAFEQAIDYFHGMKEHELPKYVLVSDFEKFKLYDLDDKKEYEFEIKDFHKNIKLFGFIAGYQKRTFKDEDPVNIKAAELMGKLHDQLEENGYEGHSLEVFLVRLLFCLFADDTGIFEKDTFEEFIEVKTNEDGSDLGPWLAQYFQVLNTPTDKRLKNLDEHLAAFPYVNGKLFEEPLPIAAFNSRMREILLECSLLNWGNISPAIFGSMFQSVMNPKERRNLGAHYTSEKNILKLIKSLFLDELQAEFRKVKSNKNKLRKFHQKLGTLKFLDPACGCGNFLIITYRELRLLELDVLKELHGDQKVLDINQIMYIDVDQFYGIEYDEFPARIAEVALWLMDHQMNIRTSEAFGLYYVRLPLRKSATIIHGNALRTNWEDIISIEKLSYILGNPPFYGKQYQTKEQKEEMALVFQDVKGAGVLDYVTAWYLKASKFIQETDIKVGFVSTNSIAQGEQTGILWNELFNHYGIKIHFAHGTFNWSNEARGKAAVHVVIIGFANFDIKKKSIWSYEDINGEPHQIQAKNINGYLINGQDVVLSKRKKPLCDVPYMNYGSMPNDGGNLVFNSNTKKAILDRDKRAEKFIKKFVMGEELINDIERWALWIKENDLKNIRDIKPITEILEIVKEKRSNSLRAATNKLALVPWRFGEVRQPSESYIALPRVSSMKRNYIPITILDSEVISGDKVYTIGSTNIYIFGILTSAMHMSWMRYTAGRMKSDFSYTNQITYNNYPWPKKPSNKNKKAVESKAQKVLDIRTKFPESSLADLYDPLTMPSTLVKAHQELDRAVDLCYRPQVFTNETARVEYLFDLYNKYTNH
ncbi:MAG: class I SAM-dependent DNA methyltransferase [Desulfobacteraceae bacterium]|nr:class I SAM-dependent DNA methyltransferase [Desulfobacteraceae bacterium]